MVPRFPLGAWSGRAPHVFVPTFSALTSLLVLFSLSSPVRGAVGDGTGLQLAARWGHGPSYATQVADGLLLSGEGSVLRVFDVSLPEHPILRGELTVRGVIMDIAREGTLVCLAAARGDLRVVDIGDPRAPREVGFLDLPGTAYGVEIAGTRAIVACEDGGLRVVDLGTPTAPVELGAHDVDLYAMDLRVSGGVAYVADMYDSALETYDLTDPTQIQRLGSAATPGPPWAVDLDGSRAILVDDYAGIAVFDVSDPANPTELGSSWLEDVGYDVESFGDLALVANDWKGLTIVDLSGLPSMVRIGSLDTDGYTFDLSHQGDVVYLADSQEGLRIVDVSTPTHPVERFHLPGVGMIRQVWTEGTIAYVVDEYHGLRILQPTTGGGAIQLGAVEMPGSPWRLDVEGGVAYVAAGTSGDVRIADVHDPRSPFEIATIDPPETPFGSSARDVSAESGRLAVVDENGLLSLWNVSDPGAPVAWGERWVGNEPVAVILAGDHAYVADHDGTVRIVDVAAPPALDVVGLVSLDGYAYDLERDGDLLFVAQDWRGVRVVDVHDPSNPLDLRGIDTPGSVQGMSTAYPYLYVADGSRVRVYDVANIWDVSEVGNYVCDDATLAVSAYAGAVHVAGMAGGWYQLRNELLPVDAGEGPVTRPPLRLDPNVPNPFNPRTNLRFALPRAGRARLEVLDAAGRRVRVLVDEWMEAGVHQRRWDGRDERGRPVASGVYRYRLVANGGARTRGMVLIR